MTIKAVLFNLNGCRESEHFLLPVEAYEWLIKVKPGNHKVPPDILKAMVPFIQSAEHQEEIKDIEIEATQGSADNDIAINLSCYVKVFHRERDAVALAKKNGWDLQEYQYDGHIY